MTGAVAWCLLAVMAWSLGSVSCCAFKSRRRVSTRSGRNGDYENGEEEREDEKRMIPLTLYASLQDIESVGLVISKLLGYSESKVRSPQSETVILRSGVRNDNDQNDLHAFERTFSDKPNDPNNLLIKKLFTSRSRKGTKKQASKSSKSSGSTMKVNLNLNFNLGNNNKNESYKITTYGNQAFNQKKERKEETANNSEIGSKIERHKLKATKKLDSDQTKATKKAPPDDSKASRKSEKLSGTEKPASSQTSPIKKASTDQPKAEEKSEKPKISKKPASDQGKTSKSVDLKDNSELQTDESKSTKKPDDQTRTAKEVSENRSETTITSNSIDSKTKSKPNQGKEAS